MILHYINEIFFESTLLVEAVAYTCSVKRVFLEMSQNSKENTCARVSFLTTLHKGLFILELGEITVQFYPPTAGFSSYLA